MAVAHAHADTRWYTDAMLTALQRMQLCVRVSLLLLLLLVASNETYAAVSVCVSLCAPLLPFADVYGSQTDVSCAVAVLVRITEGKLTHGPEYALHSAAGALL